MRTRAWLVAMAAAVLFAGASYAAEDCGDKKGDCGDKQKDSCCMKPAAGSAAFEKMKTLAGTWKGTGTTTGKEGEQEVAVEYGLTAGGSAVIEKLFGGTDHEMVSVYHDKGGKLTMTHYCMMGNQPTLGLEKSDENSVDMSLAGDGNLSSRDEPHMHSLRLVFDDADHVTQTWTMHEKGQAKMSTTLKLARVK